MSFNKRFLSEDSIRKQATSDQFDSFEKYMTTADAYITSDKWSSQFLIEFQKHEDGSWERRMLHLKINTKEI